MTSIARKFERVLEAYRRPDGGKWGGQDLQNATGGIVTRSYITNLHKGRIESPGYEKLAAIAKAVGFPPSLWFEDVDTEIQRNVSDTSSSLSERVNRLFEALTDEKSGEPYTDSEVARMSLGDLTEEEVEGVRTGSVPDPSVRKIVALAGVFGVHPSYFLDEGGKPPIIDREALAIFRDETTNAIARKAFHLPGREKRMILSIIEQLEDPRDAAHQDAAP